MRTKSFSLVVFFILLVESVNSLNRSNFPVNFLFGVASSSYQVLVLSNKAHFIVQKILFHFLFWLDGVTSMKVQQMKGVEDQVYGTLLLTNIQVISIVPHLS